MKHEIISSGIDRLSNDVWVEIEFSNFETTQKSVLFAGCTRNYLKDHFNDSTTEFLHFVAERWIRKMDIVFNKKIHIEPYADTEKGLENVTDFLTNLAKLD